MDKKRKKELLEQYTKQQYDEFINSLPSSIDIFHELFDYLDDELEKGWIAFN